SNIIFEHQLEAIKSALAQIENNELTQKHLGIISEVIAQAEAAAEATEPEVRAEAVDHLSYAQQLTEEAHYILAAGDMLRELSELATNAGLSDELVDQRTALIAETLINADFDTAASLMRNLEVLIEVTHELQADWGNARLLAAQEGIPLDTLKATHLTEVYNVALAAGNVSEAREAFENLSVHIFDMHSINERKEDAYEMIRGLALDPSNSKYLEELGEKLAHAIDIGSTSNTASGLLSAIEGFALYLVDLDQQLYTYAGEAVRKEYPAELVFKLRTEMFEAALAGSFADANAKLGELRGFLEAPHEYDFSDTADLAEAGPSDLVVGMMQPYEIVATDAWRDGHGLWYETHKLFSGGFLQDAFDLLQIPITTDMQEAFNEVVHQTLHQHQDLVSLIADGAVLHRLEDSTYMIDVQPDTPVSPTRLYADPVFIEKLGETINQPEFEGLRQMFDGKLIQVLESI
ncbi:MAG: hypothetical protein AAFO91_10185, partial [Bacteroidota bacterium]